MDALGSAAGGLWVDADSSSPPPPGVAPISTPAAGELPTVAWPADVALMRQLIDMGILDATTAASIEAEVLQGLGAASGDAFAERVLDRALGVCIDGSASGCGARISGGGASGGGPADHGGKGGPVGGGRVVELAPAVRENDVIVDSDSEERPVSSVGGAAEATARATASRSASDSNGTHKQTAVDLLKCSDLAPPAGSAVQVEGDIPRALTPVAASHSLPQLTPDPITVAAEVSLVIDTRDTRGSGIARAAFFSKICAAPGLGARVVERQLPVGEALLVARITRHGATAVAGASPADTELVLDFLVERKTAEDLVTSINDARLIEQAYYMAASGRPSLVLIVEGDVDAATANDVNLNYRVKAYLAVLDISGGFVLKFTADVNETAAYYASLVRYRGRRLFTSSGLSDWLRGRGSTQSAETVIGTSAVHTYSNRVSSMHQMRASTTSQQLCALQLHALTGVGENRVDSIFSAGFKTPVALAPAYGAVSSVEEGRKLLARVPPPPRRSPISARLSAYIYCSISLLPIGNWPRVAPLKDQSPCIVGIGLWHALWGVTSALFNFYCLFACLLYLSAGTHYDRL